jgi:transcription antitermination factor NusG
MELNKIKLFAQNAAALNKAQGKDEIAKEEKPEEQVRDNKPAEQQFSPDDVLSYLAGSTVSFQAKVNTVDKKEAQESRVSGFMADFEEAFNFAKELGLSDEAALKVLDRI